jgi:hypothetical protein
MTVRICFFVCNNWMKYWLIFHWAMGSVFKDENQIQIFIRFSSQGRVVKLLDLFRLIDMNKREKEGKFH